MIKILIMKKVLLFLTCLLLLTACDSFPKDPDNFETGNMKAVKGHIYTWKSGEGWNHDTVTCVKCIELKHRAYIADQSDSCITIKIYSI